MGNSLFSFNGSLIYSLCTTLLLKPVFNLYELVWRGIVFLNFLVLNWFFIIYYISLLTLFFFSETLNHFFHVCSQLLVEHFCDGFLKTVLDNSKFLLSRPWVFKIQVVIFLNFSNMGDFFFHTLVIIRLAFIRYCI